MEIPSYKRSGTEPTRIHYVDQGGQGTFADASEKGDAPSQTILCIHGNPTWSFYYRSIASQFQNKARVIAVDNMGCGLSDKPADYDYCLKNHTANLIYLIDKLDLKNVLMVVHDWGGAIGLGAAVSRPERIAKLLILNTAAFVPPYIPLRIAACRIPLMGSLAIRYANAFAWTATWMAIDRLKKLPQATKSGLLHPYGTPADRIAIDRFVQDIPMHKEHRTWEVLNRLEQNLSKLAGKPTTMVWGMKDWCFRPECLERLSKHLPQAKIQKLEDVGHYVMEEAPQEVGLAIEELLEAKA
jgi:cis-3-alkyl-4-acyloxetan-2-one decarboxylase